MSTEFGDGTRTRTVPQALSNALSADAYTEEMFGRNGRTGVIDALGATFDGAGVVLFAVLTQLGDIWFLYLLGGSLYLVSSGHESRLSRREGAFVLGLSVTYVVVIQVLKNAFVHPRPPNAGIAPTIPWLPTILKAAFENAVTAEGYGFPSGHALGTTIVWGGAALLTEYRTRRNRLLLACVVVVLVSVSRLALGVHYPVDVLSGALLGAIVLFVLYRAGGQGTEPGRVFLVAVAIGVVGLSSQVSFDSVAAFGSAVGSWLGWYTALNDEPPSSPTVRTVALSAVIFAIAGGLFAVLYVSEPSMAITFLGSTVAAGTTVVAPNLSERVRRLGGDP